MFGYRVGLQHSLLSIRIWIDREGQQDSRGHVEDACDASTTKVERVPSIG